MVAFRLVDTESNHWASDNDDKLKLFQRNHTYIFDDLPIINKNYS